VKDERWQRIQAIFEVASSMRPSGRDAFLSRVCRGDDALRDEIEALLRAHDLNERDEPWRR